MIFWRGIGILVPVLFILGALISQFITDKIFGKGFYESSDLSMTIAVCIGALLLYALSMKLNRDSEGKWHNYHSFMFIPIQFWSFAIPIIFLCVTFWEKHKLSDEIEKLKSPVASDVYFLDLSEFPEGSVPEIEEEFKYTFWKVKSVNGKTITVKFSDKLYSQKSGLRKLKRYVIPENTEEVLVDIDNLVELRKFGAIYSVVRKSGETFF